MGVMRKDVNIGLLILIVAAVITFSGFSVYYQTTFQNVSLEYQNKLQQLQQVSEELEEQKEELNETYSLKQKAEQDRRTLDERYQDVTGENNKLRVDLINTQSELSSTKGQLSEKTAELAATKNLLASTQSELSSVKSQRDKYEERLEEVCESIGDSHEDC